MAGEVHEKGGTRCRAAVLSVEAETPFPAIPAQHEVVGIKAINLQPYVGERTEAEVVFHEEGVSRIFPDRDALNKKAVAGVAELPVHLSYASLTEQADRA